MLTATVVVHPIVLLITIMIARQFQLVEMALWTMGKPVTAIVRRAVLTITLAQPTNSSVLPTPVLRDANSIRSTPAYPTMAVVHQGARRTTITIAIRNAEMVWLMAQNYATETARALVTIQKPARPIH